MDVATDAAKADVLAAASHDLQIPLQAANTNNQVEVIVQSRTFTTDPLTGKTSVTAKLPIQYMPPAASSP